MAVKVLNRQQDSETHLRFLNEIQLLRNARSPFVVQYAPELQVSGSSKLALGCLKLQRFIGFKGIEHHP